MTSRAYLLLTLVFYAVGALQALVQVVTGRKLRASLTVTATLFGFAFHTAGLSQRWTEAGHFPAVGQHDGLCFLAWATVLVYLLVYLVAFGLMLIADLTPASERADPILKSLFLPIHTTLAFFGYAALFVACAMGVLYLFQERELKHRSPRRFYYLIPSLERCDTIGGRAVIAGFGFLTLAIVTGLLWNHSARGQYFTWDAKEWSAVTAWAIYVMLIGARQRAGWGGRRAALLGIAGFSAVVFIFVWMSLAPGVSAAAR